MAVRNLPLVTGSMDEAWMEVRWFLVLQPFRRLPAHALCNHGSTASPAYYPHLEVSRSVLLLQTLTTSDRILKAIVKVSSTAGFVFSAIFTAVTSCLAK